MSLSGSSASRKSICAMTRLASSSSMNVGRKMIRSLSRREKMSKARSPRGVCSITIGTRAITALLYLREHLREPSRGRSGNRASCARGAPYGAPRGRRSSPSYAARPAPGAGLRGRSSPPPPPPRHRRRPAPPCRRWPPGGARAARPARRPAAARPPAWAHPTARRAGLLLAGLHAHGGTVDLRHHRAAADHEVIAVGGRRLVRLGAQRVVHHREVPDSGRAIHRAELRLLLAHLLEGGGHLVVADGARRVLHLDALVVRQRDGGLHLHHGHEGEWRVLLE